MTLSVERSSNKGRPALMRPCCDYSHLIDTQAKESGKKTQLLLVTLGLLGSLFIAELFTGLWSHSLSLLADAGHLLSDITALGITLVAAWLAPKPAAKQATFGHQRIEVLAALVNSLSLLVVSAVIAKEALSRVQSPEPVWGLPMLMVAVAGLAVNSINMALLHQASRNDLNLRGAFLHVMADAAGSVGVIFAALTVYFWNWTWADAVVSLLIACSVSLGTLPLIREALEILMEYAPRSINPTQVEATLKSFAAVRQVEKLHIWAISSGQVALCAHLTVDCISSGERDRLLKQLQNQLEQEFDISVSTLQLTNRNFTEITGLHPLLSSTLMAELARQNGDSECQL